MKVILTAFNRKLKSDPINIDRLKYPEELLLPFNHGPPLSIFNGEIPPASSMMKCGMFRFTGSYLFDISKKNN